MTSSMFVSRSTSSSRKLFLLLAFVSIIWLFLSCTTYVYYWATPSMAKVPTGEIQYGVDFADGGRDSASYVRQFGSPPKDSAYLDSLLQIVPYQKDPTKKYFSMTVVYRGPEQVHLAIDSTTYWLAGETSRRTFAPLVLPGVWSKLASPSLEPAAFINVYGFGVSRNYDKPVSVAFHLTARTADGRTLFDGPVQLKVERNVEHHSYLLEGK